jgi:hypothetical protein
MHKPSSYRIELPLVLFVIVSTGLLARWVSWPGFATHDTLFITREAVEGQYTTYHPLLNALLIRGLAVPFDSFWLYTSIQILWCCTLLYQSFRHVLHGRAARTWGCVTVVIWAVSIHTLLYLGVIWKDVPIAYGLTFLAALIFRVRSDSSYQPSRFDALLFAFTLFLCLGLRHGMIFNAILVPLLLGWRRTLAVRRLWLPVALALLGFTALKLLGLSPLVRNDDAHMNKLKIAAISQPFLGIVANKNGYMSDDYEYDRRLAEHAFGSAFAEDFTPDYFRNNVVLSSHDELQHAYSAVLKRTPRLCVLNFSTCISGRIQMFLGTLQPSTSFGGMTFYDLGVFEDCESIFGMSPQQCVVLDQFETSEKTGPALRVQKWLQANVAEPKGTVARLLTWNLVPSFILVVVILVFGRAFSPIWLVGSFFAVQLGLPFLTAMANDFRYYYFMFLFAIVFAPVALNEFMNSDSFRRILPVKR